MLLELKDVISVLAVIISGLLAVLLTKLVDFYQQKRKERMATFKTLVSCYPGEVSYRKTETLNLIKVVYYGCSDVIDAYDNYMATLNNNPPSSYGDILDKWVMLLEKMAKSLNYKKIEWHNLKNPYKPEGLAHYEQTRQESEQLHNELLKAILTNPDILKLLQQSQENKKNDFLPDQERGQGD